MSTEIQKDTPAQEPERGAPASEAPTALERNPDFTLHTWSLFQRFEHIEAEFGLLEQRTMSSANYNFTTSMRNTTRNRYMNVLANEETIFPSPTGGSIPASPFSLTATTVSSPAQTKSTSKKPGWLNILKGKSGSSGREASPLKEGKDTAAKPPTSIPPLYINGNRVYTGDDADGFTFVACQAPTRECMGDFLRTIYYHKIEVVLMLTELQENNALKADRYWPADDSVAVSLDIDKDWSSPPSGGEMFGGVRVWKDVKDPYTRNTALELIRRPFFVCPALTTTGKAIPAGDCTPHKVVMVQYTGWPDHGVPDSTASFEALIQLIDAYKQGCRDDIAAIVAGKGRGSTSPPTSALTSSPAPPAEGVEEATDPAFSTSGSVGGLAPIMVHCSAGIGRTGTLIGASVAIQRIKLGTLQNSSIASIVAAMRRSRFGMVQRVEQYMFMYMIVMQHLGVDVRPFSEMLQSRADAYNWRVMQAMQAAMSAAQLQR